MTTTSSTVSIDATPDRVWQLLTDAQWWNDADNGVVSVTGRIETGATVKLVSELQPRRTFALKVSEMRAPRTMTWVGGMPLGLFTGRRTYVIEPAGQDAGQDACSFTVAEGFTGALSGLIGRSLPDFQPSLDQFTAALKADSER